MNGGVGILKKVRISTKVILGGLAITILFVMVTFLRIIPSAEEALMARKRENVKETTETAWSVLNHFNGLVLQNVMTIEEAQKNAQEIIRSMRYGPGMKDYFWINDMHPAMIMHPYRPDMEGDDLTTLMDATGFAFCVEFVNVCRRDGAGFVEYLWQWQDDESRIVPKISYVRQFRPWGWIIGTGVYIEDVKAEIRAWKKDISRISALIALLGVVLSWFIGRAVARRVQMLSLQQEGGESEADRAVGLQAFVLFFIVPALLFVTLYWSVVFYKNLHEIIISGFDRKLAGVSVATGCFIKGEDNAAIHASGDSESPLYKRYMDIMSRIMDGAQLRYLYTQVLPGARPKCVYVIDATGESPIGDEDELDPEDYDGAERVLMYGVVHIGDIQATDRWGLLKVSYAPIYNRDNSITSMAGADVDVTIVNNKTRVALFALGVLALGAVLGAGLISMQFSRWLIAPISRLRDGALMISSGTYGHRVDVRTPDELSRLSDEFNRLGGQLDQTVRSLRDTNREITDWRVKNDLITALDRSLYYCSEPVSPERAFAWTDGAEGRTASGCACDGARSIIWFDARHGDDVQVALSRRAENCAVASGALGMSAGVDKDMFSDVSCVLVHDGGKVMLAAGAPVPVLVIESGKVRKTVLNGEIAPGAGGEMLVVVADRMSDLERDIVDSIGESRDAGRADAGLVMRTVLQRVAGSDGHQAFIGILRLRRG